MLPTLIHQLHNAVKGPSVTGQVTAVVTKTFVTLLVIEDTNDDLRVSEV